MAPAANLDFVHTRHTVVILILSLAWVQLRQTVGRAKHDTWEDAICESIGKRYLGLMCGRARTGRKAYAASKVGREVECYWGVARRVYGQEEW